MDLPDKVNFEIDLFLAYVCDVCYHHNVCDSNSLTYFCDKCVIRDRLFHLVSSILSKE